MVINELKIILDSIKQLVNKKADKTDIVQPDWNQSDETALDYVKNRTHYEDEVKTDISGVSYTIGGFSSVTLTVDCNIPLELGQEWQVCITETAGVHTAIVQKDENGKLYAGDIALYTVPFYLTSTSLTISSKYQQFYAVANVLVICVSGYTTSNELKQIDPKYIKDMYYEKEAIKDISDLTYEIRPVDSGNNAGNEIVHNLNIPFELGQTWNIVNYDNSILYENVEVQQSDDGVLYLGTPTVNDYPFYITNNTVIANYNWYNNVLNGFFNLVGITQGEVEIHQIDEKYIPDTIARVLDKDDALELAVELELIEPTTDESGNVFTDENGALYSL